MAAALLKLLPHNTQLVLQLVALCCEVLNLQNAF
jgi:hypothetical protein